MTSPSPIPGYGHNERGGPEGGQVLVDRTVETIQELWKKD